MNKKELKLEVERLKNRLKNEEDRTSFLMKRNDKLREELYIAQIDARTASEKCKLYETLFYHNIINLSDDTTLINKDGMVFTVDETKIKYQPTIGPAILEIEGTCVGRWDKDGDYVSFTKENNNA